MKKLLLIYILTALTVNSYAQVLHTLAVHTAPILTVDYLVGTKDSSALPDHAYTSKYRMVDIPLSTWAAPITTVSMANFKIVNLATPTVGTDAVNKQYVDAAIAGINPAVAVDVATTTSFAGIYSNTFPYTITATATGVVIFDGFTTTLGNRVLFKDMSTHNQNGVYTVTTAGAIGVQEVFTRASDYNTPANIDNTGAVPVINGTVNANTSWLLISNVAAIGVDPLNYTQLTYVPPNLLHNILVGNHIFVGSAANIATDVAMSGDVSIISSGVTTIANLAVSTGKIAANAVLLSKMDNSNANAQRPLVSQSSASPIWNAYAIPASVGGSGTTPYSNGTNWVMSTPTLPLSSTPTLGNYMFSNGTNWISATPTQQTTAASYTTSTTITSVDGRNIEYIITAQSGTLLFNNPTGTFRECQKLLVRIYSSAGASMTWDAQFRSGDVSLPSSTPAAKETYIEFMRNTNNSSIHWDCVGVSSNY